MISVSTAFQELLAAGEPLFAEVAVTYPDGSTDTFDEQIMAGENNINDGAESSSFPIGAALCKSVTLSIDNSDEQYKGRDFYGTKLHVYLTFQNSTAEKVDKGVYTVTTPEDYGDVIVLTGYDDMYKADKAYSTALPLPQTLFSLVQDACQTTGILMGFSSMEHGGLIIRSVPEGITFRTFLAWAAMVECANARIDVKGYLQFVKWNFTAAAPKLTDFIDTPTLSASDITITGIEVKNKSTDYLQGEEGYVLEIENDLLEDSDLQTAAGWLCEALLGRTFRSMEGELNNDPLIEFGDIVYSCDRREREYLTPITDVSYALAGGTTVKTKAADPVRGGNVYYGADTKTLIAARELVEQERTAREQAVEKLAQSLADSAGMYATYEKQQDGSTVTYLHDKPTLKESQNIIKLTAEAIGVSNDGGKTYPYGFALTGTLVTRLLYAEGINANYINSGALTVRDEKSNVIFQADIANKTVTISGDHVSIGNRNASEAIKEALNKASSAEEEAAAARNMILILSNEYQAIPVDADGSYTTFPECKTAATAMYGSADITAECSYTVSKSASVTGTWNTAARTYTVTSLKEDTGWVDIKATYLNALSVTKRFSVAKLYAGRTGAAGKNGADGTSVTITSKSVQYQVSSSGTTVPTGTWQNSVPSVPKGRFLWTKTYVKYSDGNATEAYGVTYNGTDGTNGKDGTNGTNGKDGTSVTVLKTTVTYQTSSSGVTVPTGTWSSSVPQVGSGQFLWTRTYVKYSDGNETTSYSVSYKGADGANGVAGRTYFLELSSAILKRGADKAISPKSISFSAYYRDGASATRTAYSGRFTIDYTTNWSTWTRLYTSQKNESGITYSLSSLSSSAVAIRCSLYAAGGTSNLLDTQSVQILTDVSSLTHEEIFNLLTKNGTLKGIYKEGNQLYVSFTYAKGGTLALGGSGNGNGRLIILNSNGAQVGYIDNTGVNFATGTFSGSLNAASGTFKGTVKSGTVEGGTVTGATVKSVDKYNNGITLTGGEEQFYWEGQYFGKMKPDSDWIIDDNTGTEKETKYLYFTCKIQAQDYIGSSDERLKDIVDWNEDYDDFLMELEPICYTWKEGEDKRVHTGFGAQTVKKLLQKFSMSSALVHGSEKKTYGLAYSEFHAMEIAAIQKNRKMIQELQKEIVELKNELKQLKGDG